MTVELKMLAWSVLLLMGLILIQASAGVRASGLGAMAGPRDNLPPPTGFAARARRVVDNHREGLTVFSPLVLIAAAAHVSNAWTALGAQLFFYSRVAHALIYLAGIPWVRPLVFGVGVTGTLMVFAALLGLV